MVRTWKWQCGEGEGVTSSGRVHWYVLFAEPWTKHLKGHSGSLRRAVQDFPTFTEHLQTPASRKEVWQRFNSHVLEKKEQDMAELALKMVALTEQKEGNGTDGPQVPKGTEHLDVDIADMAEKVQELYPKSKWFFLLELFWSCSWSWLRTLFRVAMTVAVMTLPRDSGNSDSRTIECSFVLMGLLAFAGLMKANRWEFVNDWEILLYALSLGVLILLQAGNTVSVAVLASATVFVAVAPVLLYLFAFAIRRCLTNVEATQSKPKSQASSTNALPRKPTETRGPPSRRSTSPSEPIELELTPDGSHRNHFLPSSFDFLLQTRVWSWQERFGRDVRELQAARWQL